MVIAVYLINRLPSHTLHGKIPVEVLSKHSPDLSHLKVFGCLSYVTSLKKSDKFAPRAVSAVFLGYSLTQKGYKMYLPQEKTFTTSRDVVFKEDIFPFKHLSNSFPLIFSAPLCSPQYCPVDLIYVPHYHDSFLWADIVDSSLPEVSKFTSSSAVAPMLVSLSVEPVRKSYKTPKPPIWMKDYIAPTITKYSCVFPISNYVGYDYIFHSYSSALAAFSAVF